MYGPLRGVRVTQEQVGERRHDDEPAADAQKTGQLSRKHAYQREFQIHRVSLPDRGSPLPQPFAAGTLAGAGRFSYAGPRERHASHIPAES